MKIKMTKKKGLGIALGVASVVVGAIFSADVGGAITAVLEIVRQAFGG